VATLAPSSGRAVAHYRRVVVRREDLIQLIVHADPSCHLLLVPQTGTSVPFSGFGLMTRLERLGDSADHGVAFGNALNTDDTGTGLLPRRHRFDRAQACMRIEAQNAPWTTRCKQQFEGGHNQLALTFLAK
jgi:hypothetical protein